MRVRGNHKRSAIDIAILLLAALFILADISIAFEPVDTTNSTPIAEEEQQTEQTPTEEESDETEDESNDADTDTDSDINTDNDSTATDSAEEDSDEEPGKSDLAEMSVTFIDVGQGDSEFVELPDGKTMLIDAGESSSSSAVLSVLRSAGIDQIDYFVISHPHADHIGGAEAILNAYTVDEIWIPDAPSTTKTYESFLDTVDNKGLVLDEAKAGKTIVDDSAGYSVELLAPAEGVNSDDMNDYSAIVKIIYGDTSFLFTGDASSAEITSADPNHVDVLKAAHHGSETGTNRAVMNETTPDYVIMSYGEGNSYGHPDQSVLNAISSAGATAYSTAANSNIVAVSDGTDVSISTEKKGTIAAGVSAAEKAQQDTDKQESTQSQNNTSTTDGDEEVWITQTGEKYHRRNCRSLSRSKKLIKMTKAQAEAQGYDPCKICDP